MTPFEMEIHVQHQELEAARVRAQQRIRSLLELQDQEWGECDSQGWLDKILGIDCVEPVSPANASAS